MSENYRFQDSDLKTLAAKGITPETAQNQLERFVTGFPYLKLDNSATKGRGIAVMSCDDEAKALARWQKYLADGGKVGKFVPASGAASRMFKALFSFIENDAEAPASGTPVAELIENVSLLPFKNELDRVCQSLYGADVAALVAENRYKDIIKAIILPQGMNYGRLPKALLTFHDYGRFTRTPLEEQLAEGAQTATGADGTVNLHFTVSAEHRSLFEEKLGLAVPEMEKTYNVRYNISISEQKPSTDTIAGDASMPGLPFRDKEGRLVFRPGGHGSLIENLNDIDATVVFVKNIDNVVPERLRESTIKYKQILGGVLIEAHDRMAKYLKELDNGPVAEQLKEMAGFAADTLCIGHLDLDFDDPEASASRLRGIFDRPLRVCGMVRNDGEPGGGPYIAYNADGTSSPQILESTQIDKNNPEAMAMMSQATHFNPVDLVCYIADAEGRHYSLPDYVDHSTGFISSKSYEGRDLLALERPGLWNGAMSRWNTIFVEVPASTFNPVKTVNDLLRSAHKAVN